MIEEAIYRAEVEVLIQQISRGITSREAHRSQNYSMVILHLEL